MAYFKKNLQRTNEIIINTYGGISKSELDEKANDLMQIQGYKLIGGTPANGTYEKGNRTMRILFGAFVKYNKFQLSTRAVADDEVELTAQRSTSGFSGGLIGMNQVRNEVIRLADVLNSL